MKIGLFGGTFNPFHFGHLNIIRFVKNEYGLDKIVLIPSATPPHKPGQNLASARDRYDMVEQSIQSAAGFEVSNKELIRKGPSFTIDTIAEFKNEVRDNAGFFLLMGSDAFLDINTWKQTDEIFSLIPIIVMLRGDTITPAILAAFIDEHVSKGYTLNSSTHKFSHKEKQTINICTVPKIDISSTMIRHRVKNRLSIKGLVPPAVEAVIRQKELYI